LERQQIIASILKARKGISQYLEIMEIFPQVDVSQDSDFQRKYNAFYRVRQRSREWYKIYFSLMQQWKGQKPNFDQVIEHFNKSLGRYEPSFSSKLIATLDPEKPIWDVYVLSNTNHPAPAYYSKEKIEQAKVAYKSIQKWYQDFLSSDDGRLLISIFDEMVPEHAKITSLKKADFVLWQLRS